MSETTIFLASLRFEGPRFENHTLDVDCVGELAAYKRLVFECAKALWFRNHPDQRQLPEGFEHDLVLRFSEIKEGSALIPLWRVLRDEPAASQPGPRDEFDLAAALIDEAIASASTGTLPPIDLPESVIPFFEAFGRTLRADEVVHVRARSSTREVAYTPAVRKRLSEWVAASVAAAEPTWVDVPKPIWETVREIGASVPDAVWQQVPPDLAARLDEYLYPRGERD